MDKKTFDRLLKQMEPAVKVAFIEAIGRAAAAISLKDVEAAVAANDDAKLVQLFALDRGDFAKYERALAEAFVATGDASMVSHTAIAAGQGANIGRVVFDATDPVATAWLRERSSLLITEFQTETVENLEALLSSVRRTLEPGTRSGQSVHTTALDLVGRVNRSTGRREGGILGLTPMEAEWAERAYSELVGGESAGLRNYLTRGPRDKRFDALVRAAIANGKPISPDNAARMVASYRNGLLQRRGERIARTETIAAMNSARYESLRQLIDRNILREQDIEHEWDASEDSDTRDSHRAMDGQRRPHGEPFVSGLGNRLLYPGDRSNGAPASDTAQCRCFRREHPDFIAAARAGLG